MVRRIKITLSQAIEGFFLEKRAAQLSTHTLSDYSNAFRKLQAYLGDPPLDQITAGQIRDFLTDLSQRAVVPAGIAPRPAKPLSKKSILNIHTALSSLWTWAVREGFADEHIMRSVPHPRPEQRAIVPLTKDDVEGMLAACESTCAYTRPGKRQCANTRPTGVRNRAIVLLLVDTGIRSSELCNLRIRDLDMDNRRLKVYGKGAKERILHIDRHTSKALWRYLSTRPETHPEDPLFASHDDEFRSMSRRALQSLTPPR
jgi:site-specific recombinase XerD